MLRSNNGPMVMDELYRGMVQVFYDACRGEYSKGHNNDVILSLFRARYLGLRWKAFYDMCEKELGGDKVRSLENLDGLPEVLFPDDLRQREKMPLDTKRRFPEDKLIGPDDWPDIEKYFSNLE